MGLMHLAEHVAADAARQAMRHVAAPPRPDRTQAREHIAARKAEMAARREASAILPGEQTVPRHAAVAVRDPASVAHSSAQAAEILTETMRYTRRVLERHVSWPSAQALDTVQLWLMHANARNWDDAGNPGPLIWRATPRLLLTSDTRGSGKSTALDLVGMLTANSGRPSKITPRAIAHKLANKHETVTIDEAKLIFGSGRASQELQGVLLAGYTRRGTYTYSSGGKDVDLKTFGPVAYAGKDELITDTGGSLGDLLDRTIIIRMRRAGRHYPDIDEVADAAAVLAAKGMAAWTTIKQGELLAAASRLSRQATESGDLDAADLDAGMLRVTQIWRPLLACADEMGGDWPARAREAMTDRADDTTAWLADLSGLEAALFADDNYGNEEE